MAIATGSCFHPECANLVEVISALRERELTGDWLARLIGELVLFRLLGVIPFLSLYGFGKTQKQQSNRQGKSSGGGPHR